MSKKNKPPKAHAQRDIVAQEMFQNCKGHWHKSKKDYVRKEKHKGKGYDLPPVIALLMSVITRGKFLGARQWQKGKSNKLAWLSPTLVVSN